MSLHRLPLRVRLVAGFAVAMLVVLGLAGAYVYWHVQVSLDHRLDSDLEVQTGDLRHAATRQAPEAALAALHDEARGAQLLTADGAVLASGIPDGRPLLSPAQARLASRQPLRATRGHVYSLRGDHVRILAVPVPRNGPAAVAVGSVRLGQRDEALRELLAALVIANLLALAVASFVGYRLARAALDPVERYRAQAEQVAEGATGVRLDVPEGAGDEISRLATTLNAMLDAQERSAARQREFIDDASHELRTPLSTLSAEIEVALRKPRTADEYEQTLRRMAGDTRQLVQLADTLLTLGALGSSVPGAREVHAGDLLAVAHRRALAQLDGHAGRAVHVLEGSDPIVDGDEQLLERALGNAVDNAIRYGSGDVTLSAREEEGTVVIAVHDEGPGMRPEFLPHAAERFRQDDASRSGAGAGLGLSLIDAIVTAHGGQLRICAGRHHHVQPSPHPDLAKVACSHGETGTTISLLLRGRLDPSQGS